MIFFAVGEPPKLSVQARAQLATLATDKAHGYYLQRGLGRSARRISEIIEGAQNELGRLQRLERNHGSPKPEVQALRRAAMQSEREKITAAQTRRDEIEREKESIMAWLAPADRLLDNLLLQFGEGYRRAGITSVLPDFIDAHEAELAEAYAAGESGVGQRPLKPVTRGVA